MAAVAQIPTVDGPVPKKWTVAEYLQLFEAGILTEDNGRYELLNGDIIRKMGQNQPHVSSVIVSAAALRAAFGEGFTVIQQLPITVADDSRPEPDVLVLHGSAEDYSDREPTTDDVAVVVEVADSRLDTAIGKIEIFAYARLREYWIIDIRHRTLEVRRGSIPEAGNWTEARVYREDELVSPLGVASSILVAKLLPSARSRS